MSARVALAIDPEFSATRRAIAAEQYRDDTFPVSSPAGQLWERVAVSATRGEVYPQALAEQIADNYADERGLFLDVELAAHRRLPQGGPAVRRLVGKQGVAFGDRPSSTYVEVQWPAVDWTDDYSVFARCGNWPNAARLSALEAVIAQLEPTFYA